MSDEERLAMRYLEDGSVELYDEDTGESWPVRPVVIAARARVRRKGTKTIIETDSRSAQTPDEAVAMLRWLPGGANRGGRTDERSERLASYRTAILALADGPRYRPAQITVRLVAARLHRTGSESQILKDVADPDIGGWKHFRAAVLEGRLSGG